MEERITKLNVTESPNYPSLHLFAEILTGTSISPLKILTLTLRRARTQISYFAKSVVKYKNNTKYHKILFKNELYSSFHKAHHKYNLTEYFFYTLNVKPFIYYLHRPTVIYSKFLLLMFPQQTFFSERGTI